MKSTIKDFIEGKATIDELKKSMEDYLNVPEVEEKYSNTDYMIPPQYIKINPPIDPEIIKIIKETFEKIYKGTDDH